MRPDFPPSLLTMPYGFDDGDGDGDGAGLTAWCQERRGHWHVTGDGWWFPGTIAIIVHPDRPTECLQCEQKAPR